MASVKTVNTDYALNCGEPAGVGLFTINANLLVTGSTTYEGGTSNSSAFFTVAANNTGSITDMGLLGQTSANTFAGLRFDTGVNAWQVSPNVMANGAPITDYANILQSGGVPGGSNTQIQFNQNETFGASAALTFDFSSNTLTLSGVQTLTNIGNRTVTPIANTTILNSNPPGQGGTGLFFTSPGVSDELISRRKALIYSIIF